MHFLSSFQYVFLSFFYHSLYLPLICLTVIQSTVFLYRNSQDVVFFSHYRSLDVDKDQSEACFDDLEAMWRTDGWDCMGIIGHRYSKSTFSANDYYNNFEEIGILLFQRQQVWPMVQTGSISGFGCLLDTSPSGLVFRFHFQFSIFQILFDI